MARRRLALRWPLIVVALTGLAALAVGAVALDSGSRTTSVKPEPGAAHEQPSSHGAATPEKPGAGAQDALNLLREGNDRYMRGRSIHPNESAARRAELAGGQQPFAIVVSCADSRVPPEVLFDRGVGDLFVVRTAGEVLDDAVIGTIEYGVEHLGCPLVVVLGHSSCGAVKATLEAVDKGGEAPGRIGTLVESIRPAVEETRALPGSWLDNAIDGHVRRTVVSLRASEPIVSEAAKAGHLRIVGARYDIVSGEVRFLP